MPIFAELEARCLKNDDCTSGHCKGYKCAMPEALSPCRMYTLGETSRMCPYDHTCLSSVERCVPANLKSSPLFTTLQCTSSLHCSQNKYCVDGSCISRHSSSYSCANNDECSPGMLCANGKCRQVCSKSEDCNFVDICHLGHDMQMGLCGTRTEDYLGTAAYSILPSQYLLGTDYSFDSEVAKVLEEMRSKWHQSENCYDAAHPASSPWSARRQYQGAPETPDRFSAYKYDAQIPNYDQNTDGQRPDLAAYWQETAAGQDADGRARETPSNGLIIMAVIAALTVISLVVCIVWMSMKRMKKNESHAPETGYTVPAYPISSYATAAAQQPATQDEEWMKPPQSPHPNTSYTVASSAPSNDEKQ